MWVCKDHITHALKLLDAPHVEKVSMKITCSFCNKKAEIKMFYDHKPMKKRVQYTLRKTTNKKATKKTSMMIARNHGLNKM